MHCYLHGLVVGYIPIPLAPNIFAMIFLELPQNRHSERSASQIYRVTRRLAARSRRTPGFLILTQAARTLSATDTRTWRPPSACPRLASPLVGGVDWLGAWGGGTTDLEHKSDNKADFTRSHDPYFVPPLPEDAAHFLIAQVHAHPHQVTICRWAR